MQNRNIIWVFTILLTLACLYQLSFSWITSSVESKAESFAISEANLYINGDSSLVTVAGTDYPVSTEQERAVYKKAVRENYLKEQENKSVYPIFGHTYKYCKDNELSKGLDLEGGMSVTLQVSIPDMVNNLAGRYAKRPSFSKPYDEAYAVFVSEGNEKEFVDIFEEKFNAINPNENLASIFKFKDENGDKLENISNEEVFAILREKAIGALDKTETVITSRVSGLGLSQPSIQKNKSKGTITIELPGVKDPQRARDLLQSTAKLEFWHTYKNTEIGNELYSKLNDVISRTEYPGYLDSVEKANDTTGKFDADTTGATETETVTELAADNLVDTGISFGDDSTNTFNPAENLSEDQQLEMFRKTSPLSAYLFAYADSRGEQSEWIESSVLGYARLTDTARINDLLSKEYVKNAIASVSRDLMLMWEAEPTGASDEGTSLLNLVLVKKTKSGIAELDGEEVENARQDFDPITRKPNVTLQFKSAGAIAWADMTEKSAENKTGIAITLDNKVFSAPVASGKIEGGRTEITGGSFNGADGINAAADLANILKAGALPAPAKIVDEAIVGPTLGAQNVKAGLWSFAAALLLVLIYMVFYYAKAGAVADVALITNIFFIFGTLASLGAALTLPGIAGIVLTIGMSVDANVLVFERIREELRNGKGKRQAIDEGYSKALSAILDANVTTLLTAIVLGYFGTGAIQGFAVTLIIGIFTSLFSALIISRLIFSYMIERKKDISFSTSITKNLFLNMKVPFIKKRKIFYIVSGLIIAGGVFSLVTRSLDYGVEFTGGRTYKVQFEKEVDFQEVRESLAASFGDMPEVKMIDNKFKALITTQYLLSDKSPEGSKKVEAKLAEGLNPISSFERLESRQVDSNISADFKASSIKAIVFSLLIIFLYIVLRFRKWQFGLGALIAMFHDVLIVLSLFSIGWGVFPFAMEINQAFIAAILTVVGYSINDTVVVFDRIREFLTEKRREEPKEVINQALNSTLSRTINTSVTTFLVLLVIFLFGGDSIKGMTFALMIGVVVGTYSSLCIATPSVIDFSKSFDFKKKQKL